MLPLTRPGEAEPGVQQEHERVAFRSWGTRAKSPRATAVTSLPLQQIVWLLSFWRRAAFPKSVPGVCRSSSEMFSSKKQALQSGPHGLTPNVPVAQLGRAYLPVCGAQVPEGARLHQQTTGGRRPLHLCSTASPFEAPRPHPDCPRPGL